MVERSYRNYLDGRTVVAVCGEHDHPKSRQSVMADMPPWGFRNSQSASVVHVSMVMQ